MEKLQQALAQAREQRSDQPPRSDMAARPRDTPVAKERAHQTSGWDDITAFEPNLSLLVKNHIRSMQADQFATPFDVLRTKIQLIMQKNNWRRLAVTSPTASCGKTTMACNLALGFTRQSDLRTALLEFDLRKPNIARTLGFTPEHDITLMLNGEIDFTAQAVAVRENVAICAAKHAATDPTATILSRDTHARLTYIEETYAPDVMIFDLPPILLGDDTRAFLKEVDCALLIAKAESTTVSQIDRCEREIAEQTNMLGVVLNQCQFTDTDESDYRYGYGEP